MHEADKIYHEKLEQNSNFNAELIQEWRRQMPKSYIRRMYQERYGLHLDEELYEEATAYFINPDDTHGPHWTVETIKLKSGIDFEAKHYNCWDFAYICNWLYSEFSGVFTDPTYYLRMSRSYLEDVDYAGKDPAERAYLDAIHRIDYFQHKI
jgi:hypothetical protein